ncbi:hypothetical protein BH24ACT26_BH24ACT26_00520 [soil metagenome]
MGAWLADHPEHYGPSDTKVTGDAELYAFWASALVAEGRAPYSGVRIEYPPGALPFIAAPTLWKSHAGSYRTGFIALMVLVDAAGAAGLWTIARRHGTLWGPWLWVLLIPLLGPLAYLRLDLVPAAATIWAVERASARSWFASGGWLGFGALAKLYPALLLPAALIASPRRTRLLAGASIVFLLPLVPLVGSLGDLWDSVIGYHSGRGVQVESTWGLGLLVASKIGYPVAVSYDFGAFHVGAEAAETVELAALIAAGLVLAGGTWLTARLVPRGDAARLAAAMFATLAGTMAVGTVLSPQFLLWLVALGAAAASFKPAPIIVPVLLLLPAAALSQALYPFLYNDLLASHPVPLVLLGLRNLCLAGAALGTWVTLLRTSEIILGRA